MATAPAARQPLLTLLAQLQQALDARFDEYRQTDRYRDGLGLQRLQLGVELLCKLEEQLLHPALSASRAEAWPALGQAMGEVDTLRDLSALLGRTPDAQRSGVLTTLESLAQLHFSVLNDLLQQADAAALPWQDLESETRALLARWRTELQQAGEIEDEDRDPVGTPPR